MKQVGTGRRIVFIIIAGWLASLAFIAQARELPDFTDLIEKSSPAVVNISTTQKMKHPKMPRNMPRMPDGTPFDEFFRHFFGDGDNAPDFDTHSLGSGFIISAEGYVLTNNHVVANADKIIVRLSDRRELAAKIVGRDERSDIALLKIATDNLPVVKIGDSGNLKVGEWVYAIGSPFGFDHSATAGIISAIGRSLPSESYVPFIQTDVAINPGNSGGPLFNMKGEVIGINSQIYSRSGGFMGLSFAIPIDVAMEVTDQLRSKGRVTRGWLGILIQDVTAELAESFGMDKPRGALVAKLLPDGPAQKAGIQVGDVIVEFDGKTVEESSMLPRLVGRSKVGESAAVKVIRNGKPLTLKVKIAELPKDEELKLGQDDTQEQSDNRLGIAVEDLSAEQRKQMDVTGGIIVREVGGGPGQRAGLRRGDVILKLNNKDVKSASAFANQVEALPRNKSVPILVQRGRSTLFLALKIEE
ncbi:MAG: DegQ family serine endoprotease [Gammaproteobacteria bacterium]